MTIEGLEAFMDCLYIRLADPDRGHYDSGIECNFCRQGDYEFGAIDCLQEAIRPAMRHLLEYHPEKIKPLTPVTDEEVAEVFGVPLPLRKTIGS